LPPRIRELEPKCVSLGNSRETRSLLKRKSRKDRSAWSSCGLSGQRKRRETGLRLSIRNALLKRRDRGSRSRGLKGRPKRRPRDKDKRRRGPEGRPRKRGKERGG
jgi:hypothetical protein